MWTSRAGARLLRLSGDVLGPPPVDRVEGRAALLDVVADGVDDRGRAFHRPGDRRLVPDIGAHDLDPAAPGGPWGEGCALGVAHGHPDVAPRGGEARHDPAAEEPRAPEDGYRPGRHRTHTATPPPSGR